MVTVRPRVRLPRWGGTRTDTRVAYLSGSDLRVVAGDGNGDRVLARSVAPVAAAWRPATRHLLAYADGGGRLVLADADSGRRLWTRRAEEVRALEWSRDGELLLVRSARALRVYGADGTLRFDMLGREAAPVAAAALAPSGRSLAFVQRAGGRSFLWVVPRLAPDASAARRVFSGQGAFTDLAWSPDGRWLLLAWRDADQWVFVASTRVRRLEATSAITRQFGGSFPRVDGWCCAEAVGTRAAAAPAPRAPRSIASAKPRAKAAARAAAPRPRARPPARRRVEQRRSLAVGTPSAGRLVGGVMFPADGPTHFTWDPVLRRTPNRGWRRVGTDRLVRLLLQTLAEFRADHPRAPRVGIGDLSRSHGGEFGARFGGLGHVSHQNGLDADVYFPRRDRRERPPRHAAQVDRRLAQDLVDRFVRAGAVRVFVGPNVGLRGNPRIVQVLPHHDNHLHVRIR